MFEAKTEKQARDEILQLVTSYCDAYHKRDRQYGELPLGYDHKYVYSHFGYNLKATEMGSCLSGLDR